MKRIRRIAIAVWVAVSGLHGASVHADHPCTSPLVLDLDGDGRILTSGVEFPVEFDINGDGLAESIGWTALDSGDGFLWLDLDQDGSVDDGSELFGSSTPLPAGGFAQNGFEALAIYDQSEFGGNADGLISPSDLIWSRLSIWVDYNHDGESQRGETRPLGAHGIAAIGLEYLEVNDLDGHLNLHALSGSFVRRGRGFRGSAGEPQLVEDIFFVIGAAEGGSVQGQ